MKSGGDLGRRLFIYNGRIYTVATSQQGNYQHLNAKWQERFSFFDTYGAPNTKEFKAAIKPLPFGKKILMSMNIWAFFFGFLFFFVVGMWKKGLVLMGISLVGFFALGVAAGMLLPPAAADGIVRGLGIAYAMIVSMSANYAYYLKQVKQQDGWNPFQGMRW